MSKHFRITQRHYNIIRNQVITNLPEESGGFLGGKDGMIMAIQPVFNRHLYDKTDTFAITSEDIERAHLFFKKHGLSYIAVYHSHPNGVAYPSKADIMTRQRYHFIWGLKDPDKPVFAAFEIINMQPKPVPIMIVKDDAFRSIDIYSSEPKDDEKIKNMWDHAHDLHSQIEDIQYRRAKYQRLDPKTGFDASDFSTFA